jgi:F-type H+-transporting ATPase subunit a
MEMIVGTLDKFFREIMGSATSIFLPFVGSLFLYILLMNLMGLIPLFHSSTNNLNTTLGLAIVVFFATHYVGFKRNGFIGYLKHFIGEPIWLAPLLFPMHIIGECARPLSLSMRLFGNIMGEDTAIAILVGLAVSLFYIPIQFPMLLLAILTSLIQAGIFAILASVYISGAGAMGHHEEH